MLTEQLRCAVVGDPVAHSLSPALHRAAYAALGLTGWDYEIVRVPAGGLRSFVAGLGRQWRGLSVTMPLKSEALAIGEDRELGHGVDAVAQAAQAANTLVRMPPSAAGAAGARWSANNTDVHGIRAALREAIGLEPGQPWQPSTALVIGSGATSRSAVEALAALGVRAVTFMVRGEIRPDTLAQCDRLGIRAARAGLGDWSGPFEAVVSTVPGVVGGQASQGMPGARDGRGAAVGVPVLDAVYGDGDSGLLETAAALGYPVVSGTTMLLHQATEQVRLMTGHDATHDPQVLAAMRAGLHAATASRSAGRR